MSIKKPEKFGFVVSEGEFAGVYAPFDTVEASDKTRKMLVSAGVPVSETIVVWTVSTARSVAFAAVAAKKAQAEAAAEVVETPVVAEVPVVDAPAPKAAPRRRVTKKPAA
jgi:hypothetical protein